MKKTTHKLLNYAASKLSGAGLSLMFILFAGLTVTELDMNKFIHAITGYRIGWIIFIYGISCSIAIDLLTYPLPRYKERLKIALYVAAGYAFFLLFNPHPISVFLGALGVLCSLFFYLGTWLALLDSRLKYLFSVVVPSCFLLVEVIY